MTCPETWFGEQAASYCTISSHIIGSSSSSNFPVGLPPLKKTSIKKKCQKGTPPGGGGGGFLFGCFWLFGQANGKITIKFRIAQCPEKIKFVCHLWTYGELYPLQIVVLMVVMRLCTGPWNLLVSLTRTAKSNWSNNWPTNQWLVLFNLKLCKEMQLSWQRNQGTTSCGIMGIFQQSSEVTQSYIFLVAPGNWYLNQNTPMIWMYFLAIQEPMLFFCIHQQSHALCLKSMASRFVYVLIDSFPGIGCFFNAPYM